MMFGTFGVLSTEMGVVGILPQIAQYFNVDITQAGLFVSLFALTIAICGIFMPLVFSKFDRKKSFILVLGIFTLFSTIGAFVSLQNNSCNFPSDLLWIGIDGCRRNSGTRKSAGCGKQGNYGSVSGDDCRSSDNNICCNKLRISIFNAVVQSRYIPGIDSYNNLFPKPAG